MPALRDLATKYLGPVERKLSGLHGSKVGVDKALGTSAYVELLIKEARDPDNFVSLAGQHSDFQVANLSM